MDDLKLDKLLYRLGKEDIVPSDGMIQRTKIRVRKNKNINLLILSSLILNTLSVLILLYIIFFTSISILLKICAYTAGSTIINLIILTIYFSRFYDANYLHEVMNKFRRI